MSVLLEHPANLVAYRPTKPTAMVVVADPRVRSTVTRHLWALGVRDVIEASSLAEARPRVGTPRDICVADVHLPDGSGLAILAETRAAGWPNGLALSAADDIGAVRSALAGGVKGYVVTGTRVTAGMQRPGLNGINPMSGRPMGGQLRRPGAPGAPGAPGGAPGGPGTRTRPPIGNCPDARSRCCAWSPRASRTRRSGWRWGCRR